FGDQYIEVRKPLPVESGTLSGETWSRSYVDGFGRLWKAARRGPPDSGDITRLIRYDARGNVSQTTGPFDLVYPQRWTVTDFDRLNGGVKTTRPDGSFVTVKYDLWTTEVTDEQGHVEGDIVDAHGRLIEHYEIFRNDLNVDERYSSFYGYTYDTNGD